MFRKRRKGAGFPVFFVANILLATIFLMSATLYCASLPLALCAMRLGFEHESETRTRLTFSLCRVVSQMVAIIMPLVAHFADLLVFALPAAVPPD